MAIATRQTGQASVELIGAVGALALAALLLTQILVAGWTLLSAGEAARVAARAAHLGTDPQAVANKAVPAIFGAPEVNLDGGAVRVEIEVPMLIPGISRFPVQAAAALDPTGAGS